MDNQHGLLDQIIFGEVGEYKRPDNNNCAVVIDAMLAAYNKAVMGMNIGHCY